LIQSKQKRRHRSRISGAFRADICKCKIKPGVGAGYYLPLARQFKQALSIPVLAVGGLRSLEKMNEAIGSGACDAVALARPLIRQPDLLHVLRRRGRGECASCDLCLFANDRATECHSRLRQAMRRNNTR
jgi:2,4-dienoyl-CoA reductase-like NADH-dependent reductase (Old Yellow Enzyme family)